MDSNETTSLSSLTWYAMPPVWMAVNNLHLLPVYHDAHLLHCMLCYCWLCWISWCQGSCVLSAAGPVSGLSVHCMLCRMSHKESNRPLLLFSGGVRFFICTSDCLSVQWGQKQTQTFYILNSYILFTFVRLVVWVIVQIIHYSLKRALCSCHLWPHDMYIIICMHCIINSIIAPIFVFSHHNLYMIV